jgi:hypothetical protein
MVMIKSFPHLSHVQGWLGLPALRFTDYFVSRFVGDAFDSLEIGVHHGLYFIALENLTPPSCRSIAADIFSCQELNIDRSGLGDKEVFLSNIEKWAAWPERVEILELDSMNLVPSDLGIQKFGIISIDGGHTKQHTINDLAVAQELITSNGLIILDDIMNQDWCGVVTGALDFFNSSLARKIVPIAIGSNKLFITHFSAAERRVKEIVDDRETLAQHYGLIPTKQTIFGNYSILSIHGT